ncbi:MAG: hypothetical protein ACRD0K_10760 [Egibacteraceae bacterium]
MLHAREVIERDPDGSYSVCYAARPKAGLTVHFWAARELRGAIASGGFTSTLELRPQTTWRQPADKGLSLRWEGIYRRPR